MLVLPIGKYMGFWVCRRSSLTCSPVIIAHVKLGVRKAAQRLVRVRLVVKQIRDFYEENVCASATVHHPLHTLP